tara:strand:- start:14 stop:247 length:234 start_codon:yes stop_codon:yes gene_type:complete
MKDLSKSKVIGEYKFNLRDENCYEARGGMYHDEDHDQVPEPRLQLAAARLQIKLKEEGYDTQIEWNEKGWIEVYIKN